MNLRSGWPARVVALATTAYSVSMTVAPSLLTKPLGVADSAETTQLIRSMGTRDVVLALAVLLAPAGYPMRLLTAARVASDAADAIWLGSLTTDAKTLAKVRGVTLGWAALQAVAGFTGRAARG